MRTSNITRIVNNESIDDRPTATRDSIAGKLAAALEQHRVASYEFVKSSSEPARKRAAETAQQVTRHADVLACRDYADKGVAVIDSSDDDVVVQFPTVRLAGQPDAENGS